MESKLETGGGVLKMVDLFVYCFKGKPQGQGILGVTSYLEKCWHVCVFFLFFNEPLPGSWHRGYESQVWFRHGSNLVCAALNSCFAQFSLILASRLPRENGPLPASHAAKTVLYESCSVQAFYESCYVQVRSCKLARSSLLVQLCSCKCARVSFHKAPSIWTRNCRFSGPLWKQMRHSLSPWAQLGGSCPHQFLGWLARGKTLPSQKVTLPSYMEPTRASCAREVGSSTVTKSLTRISIRAAM